MPPLSFAELESRIVHERDGLIVVDKPGGLPTSGRDLTDPHCLQWHLSQRERRMVWAVHQLDADTSGLNVFVTRKSLVSVVAQRMRWPKGRKLYAAVCHGEPTFDSKIVEAPIGQVSARRLGVTPEGKPCASAVTTLCRAFGFSLVRVELRTGRTHQLRIHLSHLGHPLVGEPFYRAPPCELFPRHALHAFRLELAGDEPLVLRADLPADFQELCDRLGLKAQGLEAELTDAFAVLPKDL